jgi:replication factor A1
LSFLILSTAFRHGKHAYIYIHLLRVQVILSDGTHFAQGMLATQLNHLVEVGAVQANCIIHLNEYMNNRIQDRLVVIVLNLTMHAGPMPTARIGSPVDIAKVGVAAPAPAVPCQPLYSNGAAHNGPYSTHSSINIPSTTSTMGAASTYHSTSSSTTPLIRPNPYGGGMDGGHGGGIVGASSTNKAMVHAPIVRSMPTAGGVPITPIAQLNMYQNKWTIKARLTSKSDIRTWANAKGEGSLFSVELLDSSMDIRATFFKEAVDKFYNALQVGQVYSFTGGRLKIANMQYNTCKSNFEITFDQNSEIHPEPDAGDISKQNYEFVPIAMVEQMEANKNVDILAVVKHVGEPTRLTSKKSGQELTKCDLTLVDESAAEITMTLWGDKAAQAPLHFVNTPIVAFRRARVSEYGGKTLSLSGDYEIRPDVPRVSILQAWWHSGQGANTRSLSHPGGGAGRVESLTERKDIAAIKNENLGQNHSDKPDYITFKATLTFLKSSKEGGAWYPACANAGEPCKNMFRATQTTDGQWTCEKCQGTYPTCVRRWIFSGTAEDDTSTTWVNFFNEQGELLLGESADDVYNRTFGGGYTDQDAYDSLFARAMYTEWIFRCRVKNEVYNEESRVKTSVMGLHPVDYAKESLDIIAALEKF